MNPSQKRASICALAILVSFVICTGQTLAANRTERAGRAMISQPAAAESQSGQRELKFSEQDLEQLRSDLLAFVQAYKELAASFNMNKEVDVFEKSAEQFRQLSLKQLDSMRRALSDTSGLVVSAQRMHDGVEMQRLTDSVAASPFSKKGAKRIGIQSAGFPGADYPSCGSTRTSEAVIDASDIALFVAEGVREAASRACDEVIVILGEGGNGSLVCIATDAVYIAAKAVNFGLHFCDDKIDQAELGATYGRLGHIHTDLESSVANDNANKTAIINNDNTNKTAIIINDNTNTTNIIANDNTNTASIVANDNANTASLINNGNANTASIIANDNANFAAIIANANANKNELRDLILRTQIEADLAEVDSATPVAAYVTPNSNGGYLDLVQTIVTQSIANIQAAGGNTGQAQSLLSQANAAKTAGDFKGAYALYRKAYKTAVK